MNENKISFQNFTNKIKKLCAERENCASNILLARILPTTEPRETYMYVCCCLWADPSVMCLLRAQFFVVSCAVFCCGRNNVYSAKFYHIQLQKKIRHSSPLPTRQENFELLVLPNGLLYVVYRARTLDILKGRFPRFHLRIYYSNQFYQP